MYVKGTALLQNIAFVERMYGEDAKLTILRTFDETTQDFFSKRVCPTLWYDFDYLILWIKTSKAILAPDDDDFFRKMGYFSAIYSLNRFYKFWLKLISLHELYRRAKFVWNTYCRPGEMKVLYQDSHYAHFRLYNFYHQEEIFCQKCIGYFESFSALKGAKDPKFIHPLCVVRGDPYCEWAGTWK